MSIILSQDSQNLKTPMLGKKICLVIIMINVKQIKMDTSIVIIDKNEYI